MIKNVVQDAGSKMKGTVEATKRDFQTVRTGRANSSVLDRVMVDYYGTPTAINQLANLSTPDARLIVVQPWDKTILSAVEKAINDGTLIRIPIPQLTEERRKELVKLVKKEAEEKRVIIRNIRRDANEKIKALEKDNQVTEDESKRGLDEIQKLTDKHISEIDSLLEIKEKEIMEV